MKKFLASAALLLCVFSTGLPTVHAEQPLDTVAVTGTARKMVAPDMATVTFSYETTGDTVEAVRASGAQMSTKVLAKLTALGISSADRATTRYTVAPTYTYEKNGRQKLTAIASIPLGLPRSRILMTWEPLLTVCFQLV